MTANWDPQRQAFVPLPLATANSNSTAQRSEVKIAAPAPALQALPSGKGTFIDLHGRFQHNIVARVRPDGSVAVECLDYTGVHP